VIEDQAFDHAGTAGDGLEGKAFDATALQGLHGGREDGGAGGGGVLRHVLVPAVNSGSQ